MSDQLTVTVDYSYVRLVTWKECNGDTIEHWGRGDVYDTFTHELKKQGEPRCTGILHLNGWTP
jgi:hypothetical protein